VSAPPSVPDQAHSGEQKLTQHLPSRRGKWHLSRLFAVLALIVSGFIVLFLGIGIGSAARKRIDRWTHGY
jgi:hypothetical protein